jgi:S-DNA-T family DNA segregation ATPase FtsK/SpoIIIE
LALIAVACGAAAALATWSVKDPSFSHATSAPVRNLLGAPGAIAADLATQLFGLATIAIIVPIGAWGWRLFTHRPLDRMGWRVPAWLVGLVAAAAFASCLARTPQWPLPTGIGGVVGDAVIRFVASIVGGPLFGTGRTVAAVAFGVIAFVLLVIAAGFGFQRAADAAHAKDAEEEVDEEDEGGSVSIGWLVHYFLSLKARVFRPIAAVFAHAFRTLLPRTAKAPSMRAEPRFAVRTGPEPADEPEPDEEDDNDLRPQVARPRGRRGQIESRPEVPRRLANCRRSICSPRPRLRIASRRARMRSRRPRFRSSTCSATWCAAKSSMRGRGRW